MRKISSIYISQLDNNTKWGLFYDDNGIRTPLTEDFKPVIYGSKAEVEAKLAAMDAEKFRENSAVEFTLEEAEAFAENHEWKFATTYANSAPHEYLVKRWLDEEDKQLFERLVKTIDRCAVEGYFYEHKNNYLILGNHYYWYMPCYPDNMAVDLINRTTTDYLEFRDGAYHYKPKKT